MTVSTAVDTRTELTAALGRVNAAYSRLPEDRRPDIVGEDWLGLESEIDRACAADDREAAAGAIAAWETHARSVFGGVR